MMAELEALEIHVMENTNRFKLYIDENAGLFFTFKGGGDTHAVQLQLEDNTSIVRFLGVYREVWLAEEGNWLSLGNKVLKKLFLRLYSNEFPLTERLYGDISVVKGVNL